MTAVWRRFNGAHDIVQAASRPAGGAWSAASDLSATGQHAANPQVAVDSSGNATAVWYRANGTHNIVQADRYQWDSVAPAAPSGLASSPASPANDNSPEITGTAEAGATVALFANATCTGTPVATGTAAAFASAGLTVTVADNSTTTFYATATDAAANTSSCSSSSVTYTEQTPAATTPSEQTAPVVLMINDATVRRRCVRSARLLGSPVTGGGGLAFDYTLTADATVRYVIRHRVGSQAWSFCPRAGGKVAASYKTVSDTKRDEKAGQHTTSVATTASTRRIARRLKTRAGRTHIPFARIAGTAILKPDSYSLHMTATGADGQVTDITTVRFWVLANS